MRYELAGRWGRLPIPSRIVVRTNIPSCNLKCNAIDAGKRPILSWLETFLRVEQNLLLNV
jgi:hypothetical protein